MAEKRVIDWEAIEREYIPAIRSLRDIASEHGINESAIRDRAKRYGWTKDLSAKIKAKAKSMDEMKLDWTNGIIPLSELSKKYNMPAQAIRKYWNDLGIERLIVEKNTLKNNGVKLVEADSLDCSGFIYVIYIDTGLERLYKIGLAKHFSSRFSQHQCASPFDIFVSIVYFVENMRVEEKILHATFNDKRVRGEWFKLNKEDLMEIAKRSYIGG